jgi:hypothetical protein
MEFATSVIQLLAMLTMDKLFHLLLEHPELAQEHVIPCALLGLLECEDDENIRTTRVRARHALLSYDRADVRIASDSHR